MSDTFQEHCMPGMYCHVFQHVSSKPRAPKTQKKYLLPFLSKQKQKTKNCHNKSNHLGFAAVWVKAGWHDKNYNRSPAVHATIVWDTNQLLICRRRIPSQQPGRFWSRTKSTPKINPAGAPTSESIPVTISARLCQPSLHYARFTRYGMLDIV